MSAEGKTKRGISGQRNAESSAFRLNGLAPDWQAQRMGVYRMGGAHSSGSKTMRGLLGGVLAARMGFPMYGEFERQVAHAQSRCTHDLFADEPHVDQLMAAE